MNELKTSPISKVEGEYTPPGDKSISHRLAMLGALTEGKSHFTNFLSSEDCLKTIQAFEAMGISFDLAKDELTVYGKGLHGLAQPKYELNLGNSGTTMRLLLGILAGQPFESRLTGDQSLCKRPMRRVTEPLKKMGASIDGRDHANYAPLTVHGGRLTGIGWKNEIASAQVKSAVLLAGLYAEGETWVEEQTASRDHTERLLSAFGAPFRQSGFRSVIKKTDRLKAIQFQVPGDISSAAFLMVAALVVPDSNLIVKHVGLNPTRIGLIEVLKSMGAKISFEITENKNEPVGTIRVQSSRLKGATVSQDLIPSLIDELPILMIAFALAEGTSVIRGAEELRVKETDRIHSMAVGLKAVGAKVAEQRDGCVIEGIKEFEGGTISSFGDHRTAMSFLIAGLRSKKGIRVQDTDCVQTSYPEFEADLKRFIR
jgi:3-phosphoshikimate 1-carboxyvinyltransferase